jgi:diguanylate cyclase (GGDEF)-like protein/PAS domain S-box-containing protein
MPNKKVSQARNRQKTSEINTKLAHIFTDEYQDSDSLGPQSNLIKYLESGPDGVYISDLNGHFIYGNKKAEELTGYSRNELIGHSYLDVGILPRKYIARATKLLAANLLGKLTGPDEFELTRKDGSSIWVEINTAAIKENDVIIVVGFVRDITYRKKLEEELKISTDLLNDTGRVAMVGGWEYDIVADRAIWTSEIYHILNVELNYKPDLKDMAIFFAPPYLETISSAFNKLIKNGVSFDMELPLSPAKEGEKWVRIIGRASRKSGKTIRIMGTIQDITNKKKIEDLIRESEEKYRALTDNSFTGIYIQQKGKIIFVNARFAEIHGYPQRDLIGKDFMMLNHPEDRDMVRKKIKEILNGQMRSITVEPRRLKKDGSVIWCQVIDTVIKYENKPAIMGNVIDITDRKEAEQKLLSMATHDALTGLPNRVLLFERFQLAVAHAGREKKKIAIMVLDLDKFKDINDTYGHSTGDKLLKAVGSKLKSVVREVDTVARLGGDEFVIMLWEINEVGDSITVAKKVLDSFSYPVKIDDITIRITSSLGISIYPDHGKSIEELIKMADESLYYVKQHGRANYKLYGEN